MRSIKIITLAVLSFTPMALAGCDSRKMMPESELPVRVQAYAARYFPFANNFITGWELDGRRQKIELNNGLDLEFNKNGDFLKIDN